MDWLMEFMCWEEFIFVCTSDILDQFNSTSHSVFYHGVSASMLFDSTSILLCGPVRTILNRERLKWNWTLLSVHHIASRRRFGLVASSVTVVQIDKIVHNIAAPRCSKSVANSVTADRIHEIVPVIVVQSQFAVPLSPISMSALC